MLQTHFKARLRAACIEVVLERSQKPELGIAILIFGKWLDSGLVFYLLHVNLRNWKSPFALRIFCPNPSIQSQRNGKAWFTAVFNQRDCRFHEDSIWNIIEFCLMLFVFRADNLFVPIPASSSRFSVSCSIFSTGTWFSHCLMCCRTIFSNFLFVYVVSAPRWQDI